MDDKDKSLIDIAGEEITGFLEMVLEELGNALTAPFQSPPPQERHSSSCHCTCTCTCNCR